MSTTINVERPVFNETKFKQHYERRDEEKGETTKCSQLSSWLSTSINCSSSTIWKKLRTRIPVFSWLPGYKTSYVIGDVISGFIVGLQRIHEGLAFALLAGVPTAYGLYSCFFPLLLWALFSSSKHSSIGTNAIICMMLRIMADKYTMNAMVPQEDHFNGSDVLSTRQVHPSSPQMQNLTEIPPNTNISISPSPSIGDLDEGSVTEVAGYDQLSISVQNEHVGIILTASLVIGVIQVILSQSGLRFMVRLVSDPVLKGLTTGVACLALMCQFQYIFGVSTEITTYTGVFSAFYSIIDVFSLTSEVKIVDLTISLVALVVMMVVYLLNRKYKRQMGNYPIPIEILLIIAAICTIYFGPFNQQQQQESTNIDTIGPIPAGLPNVAVPQYISSFTDLLFDCVAIALVGSAMTLHLSKQFADKGDYHADDQQETLALGICNTACSFVGGFAVSPSLSRTTVQEETGGRSQLSTLISSLPVVAMILYFGQFFAHLPKSLLACIIVLILLKNYFHQLLELKKLWSISTVDFAAWLITFTFVVLFGPSLGLYTGISFCIAIFIYRVKNPDCGLMGRLNDTNLYVFAEKYPQAKEIPDVKIFKYSETISYTNKDAFRIELFNAIKFKPSKVAKKMKKMRKESEASESSSRNSQADSIHSSEPLKFQPNAQMLVGFTYLILDTSMWSFIDSTSAREVLLISNKLHEIGVTIMLAGTSNTILDVLDGCDVFERCIARDNVFMTLHDAVVTAERNLSHKKPCNGRINSV